MRCIMVMFDSLNRHMLPPYNPDTEVFAPNFSRLAKRCATFDRSYVCSMPCMPARRDFHTGRPNFLHGGWGPLEPYDDSVPRMLSRAGVYTHLATDHYHYFEDGGATYHHRYDSWTLARGQEGDTFIGQVADPEIPDHINGKGQSRRADWVNRPHTTIDANAPQTHTFDDGLRFIDTNQDQDRWFLQIECFDPHEPWTVDRSYKDRYPSDYEGPLFDWPSYDRVSQPPEQVAEGRRNYSALMSKCDASLGHVLDKMDRHNMWEDTMLIVWTDHGFLLGEHDWWAKNKMPLYEELSHTPLFIHDPRAPRADGGRRASLTQPAIDLGPTLLRFFGVEPTDRMLGRDLAPVVTDDQPVREAAIFGYFGQQVNITDGRYTYYRASPGDNSPLNRYTLMPTVMRGFERRERLQSAELSQPFAHTRGVPLLRIPTPTDALATAPTLLFDIESDPHQQQPLDDKAAEDRLCQSMAQLMADCDAPPEQYQRMGLTQPAQAR